MGEENLPPMGLGPLWRLVLVLASAADASMGSRARSVCLQVGANWVFLVFQTGKEKCFSCIFESFKRANDTSCGSGRMLLCPVCRELIHGVKQKIGNAPFQVVLLG